VTKLEIGTHQKNDLGQSYELLYWSFIID